MLSIKKIFTVILLVAAVSAAQAGVRYHKVKYGDSLGKIAAKYGTSAAYLRKINKLKSNNIITGTKLKVPAKKGSKAKKWTKKSKTKKGRSYRVKSGDSLSKIAKRFGLSVGSLVAWNDVSYKKALPVGKVLRIAPPAKKKKKKKAKKRRRHEPENQAWHSVTGLHKVLLPANYNLPKVRKRRYATKDHTIVIYAHKFARGNAAYVEIIPKTKKKAKPTLKLNRKAVPLTKRKWGWRAIIAFSAYKHKPVQNLSIQSGGLSRVFKIKVANQYYPEKVWKKYLGNFDIKREISEFEKAARARKAKERRDLIRRANAKKKRVWALRSSDKLQSRTAHPRGYHRVTAKFFNNRKRVNWYKKGGYKRYKKPYFTRHTGLDLAGRTGAPIYAMADGKVVCSQRMFYEGNFTIIDHGNGVFTGYMHQSRFVATEGSYVKAGQLIGRVGTTGRVTGPHLHLGLRVRGKPVQPLSLLGLPIR